MIPINKPPPEPPPSQEPAHKITPHIADKQWTDDVQASAIKMMHEMDNHHATYLCAHDYTPRIKKLSSNRGINEQHLKIKQSEYKLRHNTTKTKMPPPSPHAIHIPTPKSNTIHQSSWRDNMELKWVETMDSSWDIPTEVIDE